MVNKKESKEDKRNFIDCNTINPIDYFNKNCIQECYDLLLKTKNVHGTGIDSLTYVTNHDDANKRMIVIENGNFVAKMKNGFNLAIGQSFTPFQMLQKFKYKDQFYLALSYVVYDIMGHENNYIRVGTKFYKRISKCDRFGIYRDELKVWDRSTIVDDHGRDFLTQIEKFDDFVIDPNNKEYSRIVNGNYNTYSSFSHVPKKYSDEKQIEWTIKVLKHLFDDQYQLGLTYLKVLYDHPKQSLPILVFISTERQTGKSTFIDWITMLFGSNTVMINPENIGSQFNGSYADKNIIMIEESHFDSKQATEKLKNLSTQKNILVNSKHTQEYSTPFYGKIIIASNNEDKFSKVDSPEIRYWVRKAPSLKGKANHNILNDMVSEIPYFLGFLNSMPNVDLLRSRMVFDAVELKTEALENVKLESRSELHKEIEIKLDEWCTNNREIKEVMFTASDMKMKFFEKYSNISTSYLTKTLKSDMNLFPETKSTRYLPFDEESGLKKKKSGKPIVYTNPYHKIAEDENEKSNEDPDDLPF
jgi:hypothetical protein